MSGERKYKNRFNLIQEEAKNKRRKKEKRNVQWNIQSKSEKISPNISDVVINVNSSTCL